VSALGGIAFAVAAVIDNAIISVYTEPFSIAIHVTIAAISLTLLVIFLRRACAKMP
jgi:hypothetical protein